MISLLFYFFIFYFFPYVFPFCLAKSKRPGLTLSLSLGLEVSCRLFLGLWRGHTNWQRIQMGLELCDAMPKLYEV